jgi:hypothetical protein
VCMDEEHNSVATYGLSLQIGATRYDYTSHATPFLIPGLLLFSVSVSS